MYLKEYFSSRSPLKMKNRLYLRPQEHLKIFLKVEIIWVTLPTQNSIKLEIKGS